MARRSEKKSRGKRLSLFREKPLRGRAARLDFLLDLASAAKITIEQARSVLEGVRIVVARNLRCGPQPSSRIPLLVSLRLQTLPAREEFTKTIKGKACVWKKRPQMKKIVATPLKPLTDAMV